MPKDHSNYKKQEALQIIVRSSIAGFSATEVQQPCDITCYTKLAFSEACHSQAIFTCELVL